MTSKYRRGFYKHKIQRTRKYKQVLPYSRFFFFFFFFRLRLLYSYQLRYVAALVFRSKCSLEPDTLTSLQQTEQSWTNARQLMFVYFPGFPNLHWWMSFCILMIWGFDTHSSVYFTCFFFSRHGSSAVLFHWSSNKFGDQRDEDLLQRLHTSRGITFFLPVHTQAAFNLDPNSFLNKSRVHPAN